jgi:hypothetical protein
LARLTNRVDKFSPVFFYSLNNGKGQKLSMERDFKGVWVSKEIWLDEKLGWSEKLLLVEIESLAKNGECFATNDYFAKFFKLSKDRISKMITTLKRKGFISVELIYKAGTKQIEKRVITRLNPLGENAYTPRQKHLDPMGENTYTPLGENTEDNNTLLNNTNNNTSNKSITIDENPKKKKSNKPKEKELENEFELLWKRYPRKQGKRKALKAFINARKENVAYETIEKGLKMYCMYVKRNNFSQKYIKHGSTWFNNHSWQDTYDLNETPSTLQGQRTGFLGLLFDEEEERKGQEQGAFYYGQTANHETIGDNSNLIP